MIEKCLSVAKGLGKRLCYFRFWVIRNKNQGKPKICIILKETKWLGHLVSFEISWKIFQRGPFPQVSPHLSCPPRLSTCNARAFKKGINANDRTTTS